MISSLSDIPTSRRAIARRHSSQHFYVSDNAIQQGHHIQVAPTCDTWSHVVGNELHPKTKDRCFYHGHIQQFFLKAACCSGSALAIKGLGFLSRKPSCLNKRWHCRTPRSTPSCCAIKWESNFPSHKLPVSPYCEGGDRSAFSINVMCRSPSLEGLPGLSVSASPERPSDSNLRTQ